jgi:hypothetical protein
MLARLDAAQGKADDLSVFPDWRVVREINDGDFMPGGDGLRGGDADGRADQFFPRLDRFLEDGHVVVRPQKDGDLVEFALGLGVSVGIDLRAVKREALRQALDKKRGRTFVRP